MKWVTAEMICDSEGKYGLIIRLDGEQVRRYEDLTRSCDRLRDFSRRINEGRVHIVHIDDMVEDFLD